MAADNVARPDAGAIGRGSDKGSDDDNFIVARADRHATRILAALLFE